MFWWCKTFAQNMAALSDWKCIDLMLPMDDFSVLLNSSLPPDEKEIFFNDPLFKEEVAKQAKKLAEHPGVSLPAKVIEKQIFHFHETCSQQVSFPSSLVSITVPRVFTKLIMYSSRRFNQIVSFAQGFPQTEKDGYYFVCQSEPY